MTKTEISEAIIESPTWRTVFGFILPVLAGLFSGVFTTEITDSTGIHWGIFYSTSSFYVLIALSAILFFYNRALFMYDRELMKFSDSEYCRAYMRSKCLPEAAEMYKRRIREGNFGELSQAMDELNKVLK